MAGLGIAGRAADRLIDSPLVPLIIVTALLFGLYGLMVTPREDRPDIEVPTAVIQIPFPGAGPALIDEQVARPIAAWVRELETVTEVLSVADSDAAMVTVEFETGVSDAEAYAQLSRILDANIGALPQGVGSATVRTVGSERVAALIIDLSSSTRTAYELERLATELAARLEEIRGVRDVRLHGAYGRMIRVEPEPEQMAAFAISLQQLAQAIAAANLRLPGEPLTGDRALTVQAGATLRSVQDVGNVQVAGGPAGIVYLQDVARIEDGAAPGDFHVMHWQRNDRMERSAVTLSVSSVPRHNVSEVTAAVLARLERLAPTLLPADVRFNVTYDAGGEATDRVINVLSQLLMGTVIVVAVIGLGLGWRAAVVIAVMMPVSLAIVPFAYQFLGYTLNPVSIAAMILAIGILSDDAVIMLENIARFFRNAGERSRELAVQAVNEVGNPTILADLLIVAALLPTAFITGEMGQYVRALPVGAAIAILFSLIVALTITPYLSYRLLKPAAAGSGSTDGDQGAGAQGSHHGQARGQATYRRILTPFFTHAWLRWALYLILLLLLITSLLLIPLRAVQVGLTPLLDREIFRIDMELPPGTAVERTRAAAQDVGRMLRRIPQVEGYTFYAGTGGPALFPAGVMVAPAPFKASIDVHLPGEEARDRLSYEIGRQLYRSLPDTLAAYDGQAYIRRIPSGPSREEDVEAEIYGPTQAVRLALAERVAEALGEVQATAGIERRPKRPEPQLRLEVNTALAAARGIAPATVAREVRIALAGTEATFLRLPEERRPVPVSVRLPPSAREDLEDLAGLYLPGAQGEAVPLLDLVHVIHGSEALARHRKNLLPLIYVAAEVDRSMAQALSVQLDASNKLKRPERQSSQDAEPAAEIRWFSMPADDRSPVVYWGGSWETTQTVYRDLGAAGVAVILLIYMMLAGWFRSYRVPLIIMLPIPLIFIGVVPAHWLWGLDISGVGVLGVITLAGIVARNAILLVDFIRQGEKQNRSLEDAVIQAGALRTRPIVLTAATVMFGSGVLIFEPSLEPLGLTLASGVLVSTLLTLLLIPVLYFHVYKSR